MKVLTHHFQLWAHDDVVDGDVDELDKESDEAHDGEADGGGDRDLLELCGTRAKKRI